MPTLCVYVAEEEINFLFVRSAKNFSFYNLPFAYSKYVYSDITKEEDFYDMVFEHIQERFKIKIKECDVVVTSYISAPKTRIKPKFYIDLSTLVADFSTRLTYLVSKNMFQVGANCINGAGYFFNLKEKELNLLSNLSIYTQSLSVDREVSDIIDTNIYENLSKIQTGDKDFGEIMFTGSRFTDLYSDEISKYLLSFSLIREPGVSYISFDYQNFYPLLELLGKYDPAMYEKLILEAEYEKVGTILNLPGVVECLVTKDSGTRHLVDVSENMAIVVPLGSKERAKVLIKDGETSNEYTVEGGKVGLVIDCRNKSGAFYKNPDYIKSNLELRTQLQEVLEAF